MKTLIAYYSRRGENYVDGKIANLAVGVEADVEGRSGRERPDRRGAQRNGLGVEHLGDVPVAGRLLLRLPEEDIGGGGEGLGRRQSVGHGPEFHVSRAGTPPTFHLKVAGGAAVGFASPRQGGAR